MTSILALISGTGTLLIGGTAPDGGGTITITKHSSDFSVAPESVRFWVDLSASSFDAAGPADGEFFDPRLHDLIYLWNFDDAASGDWTAPENVLPAWKNRNVAKGPFVAHMYTQPGTYNPSVLVIEPSSGKTATATLEVTVGDPDVMFADTDTVYISTSGDFAGVPAASPKYTTSELINSSSAWTGNAVGPVDSNAPAKRFLFRRGETFNVQLNNIDGFHHSPHLFGAYGSGTTKPILNHALVTPAQAMFKTTDGYGQRLDRFTETPQPIRFVGLDLRGDFDPTTAIPRGVGQNGRFYDMAGFHELTVSDCRISGLEAGAIGTLSLNSDKATRTGIFHVDDTVIEDNGGQYPVILGHYETAMAAAIFTGIRHVQNPNALFNNYTRAPIRMQYVQNTYLAGCDFFSVESAQPIVKLITAPYVDGALVNVHSNSGEGGVTFFTVCSTAADGADRITAHNVVLDGNIYVGGPVSDNMFEVQAGGVTMRNNLYVQPQLNAPHLNSTRYFCNPTVLIGYNAGLADEPILIYNNTFVCFRTTAQMNSAVPVMFRPQSSNPWLNIVSENNVLHSPNENTPQVAYAPIAGTETLWTPRNIGFRPFFARSGGEAWGASVNNGATMTVPYYPLKDGTIVDETDFAGTFNQSSIIISTATTGTGTWYEASGHFSVSFTSGGIEITNNSGVNWTGITSITFIMDMGDTAPLQTIGLVPSATVVQDYRPGTESAALLAATTGNRGWFDLTGDARLTGYNAGTIDAGAWQVS